MTVADLMKLSFYEVLGVLPGVSNVMLRKAYGKLAMQHHPDKGGDPEVFKYIKRVYDVLTNNTTRERYDQNGKAEFTADFGPASPDAPQEQVRLPYEVRTERVNLEFIRKMMGMVGSRSCCSGNGSTLFQQLLNVLKRAKPLDADATFGEITVIVWMDLKNGPLLHRRFSGGPRCSGFQEVAHEVKAGVPDYLLGTSMFMSPRTVKHIARFGLGIVEIDMVNAYYQALATEIMPELSKPHVAEYVTERERLLELGMETYAVSRETIKKLFLAVGFLGGYLKFLKQHNLPYKPGPFSDFVKALSAEIGKIARALATATPHLDELVKNSDNKLASRLSKMYIHIERTWADILQKNLPVDVAEVCGEHDGFAVETEMSPADIMGEIPELPFKVAVKMPPRDMLQHLRQEEPDHIWMLSRIDVSVDELVRNLHTCSVAIEKGPAACRSHAVAFGKVMACRIEGKLVVPKSNPKIVECFDDLTRRWSAMKRDKEDFQVLIRKYMHIFVNVKSCFKNGYIQYSRDEELPVPLEEPPFCNTVGNEAVLLLKMEMQPLDQSEAIRHKVLFADGMLYNADDGTVRRATHADRLCRHANVNYEPPDWPKESYRLIVS